MRSEVVLTPHEEFILIRSITLAHNNAVDELRGLVALITHMAEIYKKIKPVIISVPFKFTRESGGSSASVAKAVIDAFNNHFHLELTHIDYFELLKISENIYHHNASELTLLLLFMKSQLYIKDRT